MLSSFFHSPVITNVPFMMNNKKELYHMLKKALWMIFMMKKLSQTVHDHLISILIYIYFLQTLVCIGFHILFQFQFFLQKKGTTLQNVASFSKCDVYVCFPPHPRGLTFRYHSTRGYAFMVVTAMNRELTVACNIGLQANKVAMTEIITRKNRNYVFLLQQEGMYDDSFMLVVHSSKPTTCYLSFLNIRMCIHTIIL